MKNQVISFQCVLKNRLGQVLSTSLQGDVMTGLSPTGELPDLALGLQNVKPGEKRQIPVLAERAFGLYDPDLVGEIPKSELSRGQSLQVGEVIRLFSAEKKCSMNFRVIRQTDDSVFVDGNHPLAGQDLLFEVEVFAAREVSADDKGIVALPMLSRALN